MKLHDAEKNVTDQTFVDLNGRLTKGIHPGLAFALNSGRLRTRPAGARDFFSEEDKASVAELLASKRVVTIPDGEHQVDEMIYDWEKDIYERRKAALKHIYDVKVQNGICLFFDISENFHGGLLLGDAEYSFGYYDSFEEDSFSATASVVYEKEKTKVTISNIIRHQLFDIETRFFRNNILYMIKQRWFSVEYKDRPIYSIGVLVQNPKSELLSNNYRSLSYISENVIPKDSY